MTVSMLFPIFVARRRRKSRLRFSSVKTLAAGEPFLNVLIWLLISAVEQRTCSKEPIRTAVEISTESPYFALRLAENRWSIAQFNELVSTLSSVNGPSNARETSTFGREAWGGSGEIIADLISRSRVLTSLQWSPNKVGVWSDPHCRYWSSISLQVVS